MNDIKQRLNDLESKFSYQDRLIQELNEVIITHQQQLDRQANEITRLRLLLIDIESPIHHQPEESPPPHY